MRWIKAPEVGALVAFALVSVAAVVANVVEPDLNPSPEFQRTAAGIGASFFLAYVVEATWLAPLIRTDASGMRFMWLVTGFAICGLVAIVNLLIDSDRGSSGLEPLRLWWSYLAIWLLGLLVCLQPPLAHMRGSSDD